VRRATRPIIYLSRDKI